MHDTQLEDRLRRTLHEEADHLPLRVDLDRLEAELVVRRRAARSGRFGLLAAAIGIVAFGIAAVGLNRVLPSTGSTPAPIVLPALTPLPGPIAFDQASAKDRPIPGPAGGNVTATIGTFPAAPFVSFSAVCLGPGGMTIAIGGADTEGSASFGPIPCDGVVHEEGLTLPSEEEREVTIDVDARAAWHVIGTSQGDLSGVVLETTLRVRTIPPGGPASDPVDARVGCGAYIVLTSASSEPARCVESPWPDMTDQPVLTAATGDELLFEFEPRWTISGPEVRAAPFDETGKAAAPANPVVLLDEDGPYPMLRVPVTLEPGSWVVRIDLRGESADEQFLAVMFVRVEVSE